MATSSFDIERKALSDVLAQQGQDPLDTLTVLVCLLRQGHAGHIPGFMPSLVETAIGAALFRAAHLRNPIPGFQFNDHNDHLGSAEQLELVAKLIESRMPIWDFLQMELRDANKALRFRR